MTPYRISETETRLNLIDPQLRKAGWNLSDRTQVGFEIPVSGYDAKWEEGITDYCHRTNREVLTVVEAKSTSRDASIVDYNADKSRFLRVVQSACPPCFTFLTAVFLAVWRMFLQRRKLELADLYCAEGASASGGEEPFTTFGANAVEKLFSEDEQEELLTLIKRLAA